MRKLQSFRIALVPGLASLVIAWSPLGQQLTLADESRLWVNGTSTVRSYQCEATALDARIEANSPDAVDGVLSGGKPIQSVLVQIPSSQLDCSNGTMNGHMKTALKSEQHELIEFRLVDYETSIADGSVDGSLRGMLALSGVEKEITVNATATDGGNGMLRIVGQHELAMSDYGIRAPRLMMGTLRVGDKVTVNFDLLVKR